MVLCALRGSVVKCSSALQENEFDVVFVVLNTQAQPIAGDQADAVGDPEQEQKRGRDHQVFVSVRCDTADGFQSYSFHFNPPPFNLALLYQVGLSDTVKRQLFF